MKDFIYQHFNCEQLKKEKTGKTVKSHFQVKSFTLRSLLKWPHSLVLYWHYAKMLLFPFGFVTDKSKTLFTLPFMVSGHSCGVSVLNSNILGSFRTVPTVSHKQIKMQITTKTVQKERASLLLHGVGVVDNQRQWRKFPKIIFLISKGKWENVSFGRWHYLLMVLELWLWVQGFGEQREGNLMDWDQVWSSWNHTMERFQALCEICAQTVSSERFLNP